MRRLRLLGLGALLLLTSSAAPAPAREARTALSSLQATNELMATPWAKLKRQYERDGEKALEGIDGKEVAGGGGSVGITYKGAGVTAKWRFGVTAHNVSARIDLSAPPGLTDASPGEIAFAAPRTGGWSFGFQAIYKPFAWVKVAGTKIWKHDAVVPFAIGIKDFRIVARAQLNSAEPDRPRLVSATVVPSLKLGGAGAFPGVVPITLAATVDEGRMTMRASSIDIPLAEFGFAGARFNGDLTIVLRPSSAKGLMRISVSLRGRLTAGIRYVPSSKESFGFDILSFDMTVPATPELDDFLRLTRQSAPRSWGEAANGVVVDRRGWVPRPDAGVNYAAPAAALESGIGRHLPHGAVLSIDCKVTRQERPPFRCDEYDWAGEEDSAIWTGHYLAAEAFRYASGDLAALARVESTLAGIERLFWATGDTAVVGDKRVPVTDTTGVLARTALPLPAKGRPFIAPSGTPLTQRKCHYVRPEGGWAVGRRIYARLGLVPAEARASAIPRGQVWTAWGCGDDHPVSKDQYSGVFYGLAIAHQLVPVPAVQARARALVRQALDYLLANGWNVRLAPENRYETTFLGDFPKQLAFLRIGATLLGGTYLEQYRRVSPAAASTWIPLWFSAIDPVLQYYKFNLSHTALASALLLENDPALRAGFAQAHAVMWRAVRHHRNAYFGLLRVLMRPAPEQEAFARTTTPWLDPTMTVAQEIQSELQDWIRRYELVKSPGGMPTGALADPAFAASLAPSDVATFVGFDGTTKKLATFALPQTARTGSDKDFVWQRHPFDPAGARPARVHPGVDYLLAYWLARYLRIVPAP